MVKAYFSYWLKEAHLQKSSPEPALFKSHTCPEFGSGKEEVFFLTSNYKKLPTLRIFNMHSRQWEEKTTDLPLGKIFKIDGTYYARSSAPVKPHTIHYSLFSEGLYSESKFDSQYVQDINNQDVLSIDSTNNLNGFKLYLNRKFYSYVHSNALFDKKGNIYFFKQRNKTRTLYKNKKPLFAYRGYYGHLLDIENDGTIYFIGASAYGSSIYQYRKGQMSRSVSSDTVVQAKRISNREFLVCEITPYDFEYKIIPIKLRREKPILYHYTFKKRKQLSLNLKTKSKTVHVRSKKSNSVEQKLKSEKRENVSEDTNISSLNFKTYSGVRDIRYKGMSVLGLMTGVINTLGTKFLFSDYLMNHLILLQYDLIVPYYNFDESLYLGSLNYWNDTYRLRWGLGYKLLHLPGYLELNKELSIPREFTQDHIGHLKLQYRLFQKGHWTSSVSSLKKVRFSDEIFAEGYTAGKGTVITDSSYQLISTQETMGVWRGQIDLSYKRAYPFNYEFNKAFLLRLFLDNRYYFNSQLNGFKFGVIKDFVFYLGRDFYIFPSLSYAYSFNPEINPVRADLYTASSFHDSNDMNSSLSSSISRFKDTGSNGFVTGDIYGLLFKSRYQATSITTLALGVKKAFNVSWGVWDTLVPLARVRWLVLENLMNFDRIGIKDIIDSTKNKINDISLRETSAFPENIADSKKKQDESEKKYIHWLEWTVGLESEILVYERARLVLGFSLGIRTPLRFWNSSADQGKSDNTSANTSDFLDLKASTAEIYFKMPL